MKPVYLDNAATTPMLPEVIEVVQKSMLENFGNPSSIHQLGRKAKSAVEKARKNIAKHFNVSAGEIIFTSSGTEADNLILHNAVTNLGVKRIVTSVIEHHAVLHTVEYLQKEYKIDVVYVKLDAFGVVDLQHLNHLLSESKDKTLVSLMMVNNEIGNLLPMAEVCEICKAHNALFHSDTVQAIGRYKIDLQKTPIDFIVASAHKFHGPKGVGFAYFKKGVGVRPMLHGGNQEKGARSSTENVHAILGMEKALEVSVKNLDKHNKQIIELKFYFIQELKKMYPKIQFNGKSDSKDESSYAIVNICFPFKNDMMLFKLDLLGVLASGGSACQSGSNKGSHVLAEILSKENAQNTSVRFSFSRLTSKKDIDFVLENIKNQF